MPSAHPTDESAGTGPRVVVVFSGDDTGHDGKAVASGSLDQSMTTGGQVVDQFGMQQVKILEINHVEIGTLPNLKRPSIAKPINGGRFERLHPYR